MRKRTVVLFLVASMILACAVLTQLQPTLLHAFRAVDGSFGIRPMSHQCAGIQADGASLGWLPAADFRFTVGRFSVLYWVDKDAWPGHPYCIGQDVWFGE